MSQPYKASTRWQENGAATHVDGDQLTVSLHVTELESGHDFTVSVTGSGQGEFGYFIAALQCCAAALNHKLGMPEIPGAKFLPRAKTN